MAQMRLTGRVKVSFGSMRQSRSVHSHSPGEVHISASAATFCRKSDDGGGLPDSDCPTTSADFAGYFAGSSLDAVRDRIRALSDSDLRHQCGYVAAAFGGLERACKRGGIGVESKRDIPGSEIGVPLMLDATGRIVEWPPMTAPRGATSLMSSASA
ncbi:hypothetical protein AB0A95_04755 [Micromonospora sp. NPDC049230]|uniref:hypothetical protein n=1 Tax=Micromonospora sp. NPDC049230 TaxID=3155502 RepID=UPI0033D25DAA